MSIARRRFLRYAAAGAALLPLPGCRVLPRRGRLRGVATGSAARRSTGALEPAERATIAAVCARLLPSDQDPGAREAQVIDYIDQELHYTPTNTMRPIVQRSARLLDQMAKQVGAASFVAADEATQDKLLQQFYNRSDSFPAKRVFAVLIELTIEGFLCDPVYGGNFNKVGWKMIGWQPRSHGRLREPYRVL